AVRACDSNLAERAPTAGPPVVPRRASVVAVHDPVPVDLIEVARATRTDEPDGLCSGALADLPLVGESAFRTTGFGAIQDLVTTVADAQRPEWEGQRRVDVAVHGYVEFVIGRKAHDTGAPQHCPRKPLIANLKVRRLATDRGKQILHRL